MYVASCRLLACSSLIGEVIINIQVQEVGDQGVQGVSVVTQFLQLQVACFQFINLNWKVIQLQEVCVWGGLGGMKGFLVLTQFPYKM